MKKNCARRRQQFYSKATIRIYCWECNLSDEALRNSLCRTHKYYKISVYSSHLLLRGKGLQHHEDVQMQDDYNKASEVISAMDKQL